MQLVADANVRLSAVIGGRAALALRHDDVEQVFTPVATYDEVLEYLPSLGKKKRLELDTLLLAFAALPVTVVDRSRYRADIRLTTFFAGEAEVRLVDPSRIRFLESVGCTVGFQNPTAGNPQSSRMEA